MSQNDIEQARVRARRRMIGMAVLVSAGVIGFPWLFETQPRPMQPEVTVVSKAASSGVRGAQTASDRALAQANAPGVPPMVARALDAERSAAVERGRSAEPLPREEIIEEEAPPPQKPVAKPAPAPKSPAKPPAKPDVQKQEAQKAQAAKAAAAARQQAEAKSSDAEGTRYIVQVGAFSDGPTAHAARMKVERLGIKTYTQAVNTPEGKRIRVRVGPYASKADADKAAATIRKAGLSGALLTL